jgi:N-hydroxyarylamine O-acetyltransferase
MPDPAPAFDLDAYLARIGYGGPREPTLAVLQALQVLHPHAIPYENLSPLMGDPVPLDLDAIQAKLLAGGRGGYCYEQNHLFRTALEALGFLVTPLAARVRWNTPQDAPPRPRTHMLLLVALPEGPHVADVGFGGVMLTGPLRLEPDTAQDTPHERYRLLVLEPGAYELQAELGVEWRPLYRFDLTPQLAADYEMMNWYSATHPSSRFRLGLAAARAGPQGRMTLADTRFTVRRPGEPPVERILKSLEELKAVLTGDFGLTLPAGIDRIREKIGL